MKLTGIYPALLTSFTEEGQLNKTALRQLVDMNIEKGVDGFYVCGSTAEAFFLSVDGRKEVLETVVEQVNGRCKVVAHIGHISTDTAIDLAKHAQALAVDAISSVSPFYYNFTFSEIQKYYFDIVDSVALPMIVYNFPAFAGVNLTAENISTFFEDERFIALKNTSSDFFLLQQLKARYPQKAYFNGYDEMFLSGLAAGADGAIGSTFNFMAEKFIRIRNLFMENKITEAQEEQRKANEIIAVLIKVGIMAGGKALLCAQGIDFGIARRPFRALKDDEIRMVKEAWKRNL